MTQKERKDTPGSGIYGKNNKKNCSGRHLQGRRQNGSKEVLEPLTEPGKEVAYLTLEGIEEILQIVMDESAESGYVRERARILNPNLLDLILDLPSQGIYNIELYKSIYQKAAVYLREIILQHVCEGACKRTAIIATATFLRYNGYILNSEDEETDEFCLRIANECLPIQIIADWIEERVIPDNKEK